ncbi:HNH endonuclease family protein [Rhodococcus sp. NPDC059234]|uniref:HNH endonuclease family protein n=1 Tax=Rhodococcus sp. NPDC059234 TaxID=3346781 RepID=UPI00366F4374
MSFHTVARPRLIMIAACTAALTLTGCGAQLAEADASPTGSSDLGSSGGGPAVDQSATLALLDTLAVKGRAPKTGYSRDEFGQAWSDDVAVAGGHNGCDTRNDILDRDLTNKTYKAGKKQCIVLTGTLNDPYTGKQIQFTRGQDTSTAVQIDHVVALSDAWQKGAQQLDADTRRNLANDPRNLLAVDGPANQQKSDGDAATWLPSNKSYRCTYVAKQVEVKAAYKLWVTQSEKDAIVSQLGSC